MGQDDFIIVEDGAVGVYLDGVYVGRTLGSVFDLVDVERVCIPAPREGLMFKVYRSMPICYRGCD